MRWMKSARHRGWEIRRNRSAGSQSLRRAASSGKEAVARLLSALEHLGAALGGALQSQEAMEEVQAPPGTWRPPSGTCPTRWQRSPAFCGTAATKRRWERRLKPWRIHWPGRGCAGTGGERRRGPHGQRRAGRGQEGRGGRMAGTGRGGSGPAGRRRTRHRRGSAAGKASGTGRRPGGSVSGPRQDVGESGFPGIPPRRGPGRRLLGAGRGAHHHHPSH